MTDKSTIQLRPATLDDVDLLAALSHKTVLAKYPDVIGREMVEGYVASGAVPTYYRERNAYCTVAMLDGEVIGACAVKDNAIDLMMVDLAHHRSGVGAILLEAAEADLGKVYDKLSLECFRDNLQAVNFYKKHGWNIVREFKDEAYGIPMVEFEK